MNERATLKVNKLNHLEVGGVDVEVLAKEYGTPLYVMDQAHIENMCKAYLDAFNMENVKGRVIYASKAFCCKEIYRLINKMGVSADVVSGGELYTALSADFSARNLVFHGNNKTPKELDFAVKSGIGYVVLDSYQEALNLQEICAKNDIIQNVLIRINPGVEAHTHHYIQTAKIDSKFGFSISNGDALNIIEQVLELKNLKLLGLHCHIGSQIFDDKSFLIAVDKMLDFYKQLKDNLNVDFSLLNLGGGFGIWYSEGDRKFTYQDYTNNTVAIIKRVKEGVNTRGLIMPEIIIEPGRSLVGEAGITLYSVGNIKTIKDVKNYIAIDGGMFENPRFALYQAKYTVVPALNMQGECLEKYTLAGKCCESGDMIAEDVMLPKIKVGDILAVLSTGAYNYSMSSNYNRNLVPPVVFVKDGNHRLVVKGNTFEDLIRNDI